MRINEANLLLGADLLQERKHYLQSQVTEIRREMGDPGNDGRSKNCPAGLDHGSEVCDIMCVIRANLIFSDEARGADTFIRLIQKMHFGVIGPRSLGGMSHKVYK